MFCLLCYLGGGVLLLLGLSYLESFLRRPRYSLRGRHVLITGASSGIGLSLARQASREGAKVTLVARNTGKLTEARAKVLDPADPKRGAGACDQAICLSLDVSADYEVVSKTVADHIEKEGPIDVLINCAGIVVAHAFLDTPVADFSRLMTVNHLGAVHMTRAVLPSMLAKSEQQLLHPGRGDSGRIAFVSSMVGQFGIFGYTAYSPSKFAMCGFAETLRMELKPRGVRVTVAYPPDTDTPAFAEEKIGRPEELAIIGGTAGVANPDTIAASLLRDIRTGRFHSSFGLDGQLLTASYGGLLPETLTGGLLQVMTAGLLRLGQFGFFGYCDWVVGRCAAAARRRSCEDKNKTKLQ